MFAGIFSSQHVGCPSIRKGWEEKMRRAAARRAWYLFEPLPHYGITPVIPNPSIRKGLEEKMRRATARRAWYLLEPFPHYGITAVIPSIPNTLQ